MSEYLDGKLETEDQLHPSDKSRHHSTGVNGFAPTYASGESGDISMELAALKLYFGSSDYKLYSKLLKKIGA